MQNNRSRFMKLAGILIAAAFFVTAGYGVAFSASKSSKKSSSSSKKSSSSSSSSKSSGKLKKAVVVTKKKKKHEHAEFFDVQYTKKGFEPASVSVDDGDYLKIINNSGADMKLAEGTHPKHDDCIACPQGRGKKASGFIVVKKGKTFTEVFHEEGNTSFHDERNPKAALAIVVH